MPDTRPRISFDVDGVCNACQWAEEKRTKIDWTARREELLKLCDSHRSPHGNFDCIVPVSGGKDSSYVAYMMKHEMGMHPLCVNVTPPLEFDVGRANLSSFVQSGFDCIQITPDPNITRRISRRCLAQYGQPLMSWIINVQAAIFKIAINFNVPLVMFGEDGEVEYGGVDKLKNSAVYDIEDSIKLYLSGVSPMQFRDEFSDKQLYWWLYPSEERFRESRLAIAHWSYFENWDPYQHYLVAKAKAGLKERPAASVSTYNNFAQTDTSLYDLHVYLMYLKFGFGRCTQDVGIDIRRGAMTRKQGLQLVRKFDGAYPEQFIPLYLDYFQLTSDELAEIFDRHANKRLFSRTGDRWTPLFIPT